MQNFCDVMSLFDNHLIHKSSKTTLAVIVTNTV